MHVHRKAWRNIVSAAALVTFALPLASPLATPAAAQTTTPPASITTDRLPSGCTLSTPAAAATPTTGNCIAAATPRVAFNAIGTEHTATFVCDAGVIASGLFGFGGTAGAATVPAGCYNVQVSVTDIATGAAVPFTSVLCGNVVSSPSGDCSGYASPICPATTFPATPPIGPTTPCGPCPTGFTPVAPATTPPTCTAPIGVAPITTAAACTAAGGVPSGGPPATTCTITVVGYRPENTVTASINPSYPGAFAITFTGYVPTTSLGSCPAGTTFVPGVALTVSIGVPPVSTPLFTGPTGPGGAGGGACRFSVTAQKKYVEITKITITQVSPVPPTTCGGNLLYAEGLKAFFGPSCTVIATAVGSVTLKTGVNCANEPAPGTPASGPSTDFPVGSTYNCVNGSLLVENIPISGVNIAFTVTGPGSFNVLNNLDTMCSGVVGSTTNTVPSGTAVTFCPTGPGSGTIQACLAPATGTTTLPNNQPALCSGTIPFTYTQRASRVVPYVRWAGQKIALTKCFGPGLAGSPVEFVLKGNNPGLNATLLPTDLGSTQSPVGGGPVADTIWTVTDVNGCATVLGYADGEGVMYVDAAIYSFTSAGAAAGSPLVNEHAFEVFYMKFDHVDLENINFTTYATASAIAPYLNWSAASPAFVTGTTSLAASSLPASLRYPGPPGSGQQAGPSGYSVPLCATQYVRAMVHGYFEISGDPSGRPASTVAIPGAPANSAGSYVLPAGRWVLPEDWPVLATFAGYDATGNPTLLGNGTVSSVYAWDLNSGWVFNPAGESPVLCNGDGVFAPSQNVNGTGFGAINFGTNGTAPSSTTAGVPATNGDVDLGPCFGQDVTMLGTTSFYSTAPAGGCAGGLTVGIGPFDPTQVCTNPFPLTYTPSGGSLIGGSGFPFPCTTGATGPCLVPNGLNSTYLPNGTLNQWDAPMPAAQISFGITSGPGYLAQVNKTGLYALTLDVGPPGSSGCPTGYAVNPSTITTTQPLGTCQRKVDPNPFYATAIPESPFIPPITNNGGYLWNSFGFTAGAVTTVRSSVPITGQNAPAGGFVPGESTTVTVPAASFPGAACPALPTAATVTVPAGSCAVPGGINISDFPAGCTTTPPGTPSVLVANGAGFLVGQTVEVYAADAAVAPVGTTVVGGGAPTTLTITAVLPSPQPGFPNAVELQFSAADVTAAAAALPGGCAPPFSVVFIAEQFGLPVPSAAAFTVGQTVDVGNLASTRFLAGATVTQIDTTNNIVYINSTAGVAAAFGPCTGGGAASSGVSRPGGPASNPNCEPNLLVPPGTLIQTGPVGAGGLPVTQIGTVPNPYPFWQWLPAPPAKGTTPTTGTVYSDNHGEAVVSLNTSVTSQFLLAAGATCPAGYTTIQGTSNTFCLLNFGTLGTGSTAFVGTYANVAAALKGFSASNPGCIQTFASGTYAALTGATIGATGPGAGQICVNNLGGIEFGTSATLGSTTVQAVADYPYTRGEHPPVGSAPLIKVWTSQFAKTLSVSPGTPGPAGTTTYTVTITALDICGTPIVLEPVNVYALGNAGAAVLAPVGVGAIISASSTSATVLVNPTTGTATLSLEVLNTAIGTQGLVVKAVWPFEKIERFATVIPGTIPGQTANVVYAPGWNQVGGPPGSNFSVAEAAFAWDPTAGTYTNVTAGAGSLSSAAPACTGYWAYFAAAMSVSLPVTSKSGDKVTCSLAAGWNLVGNPFGSNATLPSGTTAYHWNGTSYDVVGIIPLGGSVWIFNNGTLGSLTLTAT